jgi:hypothetical protein
MEGSAPGQGRPLVRVWRPSFQLGRDLQIVAPDVAPSGFGLIFGDPTLTLSF